MSARSRERSRAAASYLKDHRVERTSGMCPWGCGRTVQNGGEPLLRHLNSCRGNPRKDNRARSVSSR